MTILIPILNEEAQLKKRAQDFHQLRTHPHVQQLLFSDSGSTDSSCEYLRLSGFEYQTKTFQGAASIGQAIFQCMDRIESEKVLILPVDVLIDSSHLDKLYDALKKDASSVYVFEKEYDVQSSALKLGEWLLKFVREGVLKNFVWTNAFCVAKSDLIHVPRVGFLEDVLLNDQLKKIRKISRLKPAVTVSARKYMQDGPWFRLLVNLTILALFRTGRFEPKTLKKLYRLSKPTIKKGDFHESTKDKRICDGPDVEPAGFRVRRSATSHS